MVCWLPSDLRSGASFVHFLDGSEFRSGRRFQTLTPEAALSIAVLWVRAPPSVPENRKAPSPKAGVV